MVTSTVQPAALRGIRLTAHVGTSRPKLRSARHERVLLESVLDLPERTYPSGASTSRKTAEQLVLDVAAPENDGFTVGKLLLGYLHQFGQIASLLPVLGLSASVNFVGSDVEPFYGRRMPLGFAVFGNLRPAAMSMPGMARTQHGR